MMQILTVIVCFFMSTLAIAETTKLSEYKKAVTSGDIWKANQIQKTMDENEKKESIKFYKKNKEQTKKLQEIVLINNRKTFAKKYEQEMLNKGLDVYASAIGKNNTTFKLKFILTSRPLVYNLINDNNFMLTLTELGFKKFIMTDGYHDTWSTNIK